MMSTEFIDGKETDMSEFSKKLVMRSAIAAAVAIGLGGCGDSDYTEGPDGSSCSVKLAGVGGLSHASDDAPIKHLSKAGWRTEIAQGRVTVMPPVREGVDDLQYVFDGAREWFDETSLRDWPGGPRTIVLPGNTKLTMHAEAGRLDRVSLYDDDESHDVDVMCHAITHSAVEGAEAVAHRDAAEADGESGYLLDGYREGTYWPGMVHLVNAYVQATAADGAVLEPNPQVEVLGSWRVYGDTNPKYDRTEVSLPLSPAESPDTDVEGTCAAPGEMRGRLTQDGGLVWDENREEWFRKAFDYISRNGRTKVNVNRHTITMTVDGKFTWQVWGDPHEKFQGKHIKDWLGRRRTLLLPDGVKVTMHAAGPTGVTETTSIYDGAQSHEIDNFTNQARHSCVDAAMAQERDAKEHDGETAVLGVLRSKHSERGAAYIANIYHEGADTDGGPHVLRFIPGSLGLSGEGDVNPNEVNKLWKDPD